MIHYRGALISAGAFLFRFRNIIFPMVLLWLVAAFAPHRAAGSALADGILDCLGVALLLAGQTLRAAVIGFVYISRGGKNRRVHADSLVTEGFFSLSRNPLYAGNLLIYAGLLVVHNNPWAYLLGGGFFAFAYWSIVAAEEDFLTRKFGAAYVEYCARTNRWLPEWPRLPEAIAGIPFNWRRVIVKDYGTVVAWMLALLLLLAREQVAFQGMPLGGMEAIVLSSAATCLVVLWGFTRWLKKSGRLKG